MMIRFAVLLLSSWFFVASALAADLSEIAGRYRYVAYAFTLPNGQSGDWTAFGSTGGTLDIAADNSMVMTMHMRDGNDHVARAEILEYQLADGKGYLLVKWPDMAKPVKQQITVSGDTITYVIHFDDPSDVARFGGSDRGTLERMKDPKRLIGK